MNISKHYELSIIVPCYNEEGNVLALCSRLLKTFEKHSINGEILLVNDGSTDNTASVINELSATHSQIVAIHHPQNKGMEGGWRTGLQNATGRYICFIDADLQYLPEEIWRLYREIIFDRYDIVQGTRSSIGRLKDSRYTLSKGLNILLNILFGMRSKDNKSGFVMALRETMLELMQHRFHYYYFQTFITVAAKAKGYRVGEVETLFQSRYLGESFINKFPVKLVFRVLTDLVKGFVEYRILPHRIDSTEKIMENYASRIPAKKIYENYPLWRKVWMEFYFLTFPLHKWKITRKAKKFYYALKRTEWLSADDIEKLQNERLSRLLSHVDIHVPYYRNKFRELGIKVSEIRALSDITTLPLLTKDDVRQNLYFDLFADNHRKKDMLNITTSGSTGEPFITYADRSQLEMRMATTLRCLGWTGWRMGDKQMRLWHQKIGMSSKQAWMEKTDAFLMRRKFVPAFEMDDKLIGQMLESIKTEQPKFIDGYAESFNFLAHYILKSGATTIHIPAMMSSAQTLTDDTRKVVEQAFGTKLFDKYGSREFSGIAYECGHGNGYHIMAESYIVEVLKDGKPAQPGEIGEIVITDLNNFSTPLIRYKIGDMGALRDKNFQCACGRKLPMIEKIEGRVQSIVRCKNGRNIPGTFFSHLFKDFHFAVRQYQILQTNIDGIELKIICEEQYNEVVEAHILKELRNYLGNDMAIDIQRVDNIPLTRTGKHLSVISKITE